ncbi:Disks large-like protein 5 [Bienertia sinuspersici]
MWDSSTKAGEISLIDEVIYANIKPKGKRNSKDPRMGVSPSTTSLFGGFSKCEKLRKEADKAMNEAAEAKKEAISANEQNIILTKKLKDVKGKISYKALFGEVLEYLRL